jgi:hypothetical protein
MSGRLSLKTVRTLVRLMRAQKVQSFEFDALRVEFAPQAFDVDAPIAPAPEAGEDDPDASERELARGL